jgi:hypothetical protein
MSDEIRTGWVGQCLNTSYTVVGLCLTTADFFLRLGPQACQPMKTKTLSLKLFQPAVLAALAIAVTCGLSVSPALAGYIVTLQQVGPDVVATGSGPIDLTGLTSLGTVLTGRLRVTWTPL